MAKYEIKNKEIMHNHYKTEGLCVFDVLIVLLNTFKTLCFGNKKGFAVPQNGIIFSENSENISSH